LVIADGYPVSAGSVAATGAVEITVHAWDVGRAIRQPRPIPPALASDLLAVCPPLVLDAGCHRLFGAPVAIPRGASTGDRLVATLGRDPAAPCRGVRS
jgi:hypothetical protein